MEKRIVIVGAGISGLLACKYAVEKGFHPVVFEADSAIGGVWFSHVINSTKLQNVKQGYRFSDFDWPPASPSGAGEFPHHSHVLDYVNAYAEKFCLLPYIRLNSRVTEIDYVGKNEEEMEVWDQWGGAGAAFGSGGKWHVTVHDTKGDTTEVHEAEFVILCVGRFSGVPNIPELPAGESEEVFNGRVMHAMEYSSMRNSIRDLIKGKRITVIGSQKSAVDIAAECAYINGVEYPCTMIQRTPHWLLHELNIWGVSLGYLYLNRFAELLIHKPGEGFVLGLIATLISPLRWGISKFVESYLRWKLPLKKYGLVPDHSFLEEISSCQIGMLPEKFYDRVKEGSIIVKRSKKFGFTEQGIAIQGDENSVKSDIVILATGYKGNDKVRNVFSSGTFRKYLERAPLPLYRQTIHPRIPQLAVIGYSEGLSNLPSFEIRCQWLAQLLDGRLKLPSIKEMEENVERWERHMKEYGGKNFWRSCVGTSNIWSNDQLCHDMGRDPRRKKGFFAEWFRPYGPNDYVGLTRME